MPNLNKVLIMGNLTRDPEVKYTPKGTAVGNLGIAINDSYKTQDGTVKETVTFVDIEVWGRQAETCKQYLVKGRPIFVEGKLQLDQWEDNDGKKHQRLKVRADRVQFLGGNDRGGSGSERTDDNRPPQRSERPVQNTAAPGDEDDIPF